MNIIYANGAIVDVVVFNEQLQSRMTTQERVAIFGRGTPDAATIAALAGLEENSEGATVDAVCAAMVAAGDVTAERANEIKA